MFRPALLSASRAIPHPARQAARGYASAPAGGSSNLPLLLAGFGAVGLGGYVYLQQNPTAKTQFEAKSHDLLAQTESKASDLKEKAAALVDDAKLKVGAVENEVAATSLPTVQALEALVKDTWVDFKLEKVEGYNYNTNIYTFSFPTSSHTAGGQPASALLVRATDESVLLDDKGKPVVRPYTPISAPDEKGSLKLMIKKYKGGKMSEYIDSLKPGQTLSFKGPISKFPYTPNVFQHGICIAGGSGITPMYQLIGHSLSIPDDKTKWTLIFSNVGEKDILLRKEWEELEKKSDGRLKVVYSLDKPGYFWKGETGFVTPELIAKYAPQESTETRKFFVCGPPGQVKALAGEKVKGKQGPLAGALKTLNYTEDDVFKF